MLGSPSPSARRRLPGVGRLHRCVAEPVRSAAAGAPPILRRCHALSRRCRSLTRPSPARPAVAPPAAVRPPPAAAPPGPGRALSVRPPMRTARCWSAVRLTAAGCSPSPVRHAPALVRCRAVQVRSAALSCLRRPPLRRRRAAGAPLLAVRAEPPHAVRHLAPSPARWSVDARAAPGCYILGRRVRRRRCLGPWPHCRWSADAAA